MTRPLLAVVCPLFVLLAAMPALGQNRFLPSEIVEAEVITEEMYQEILMIVDPLMFDLVRPEPEAQELSEARKQLLQQFRPAQASVAFTEALSKAITESRMEDAVTHKSSMVRYNAMIILKSMVDAGSEPLITAGLNDANDAVKRGAMQALGKRMLWWKARNAGGMQAKITNAIKQIVGIVGVAKPPHPIVVGAAFEALLNLDTPASREALIDLLNKRVAQHKSAPDLSYSAERTVIERFANTLSLESPQDTRSIKGLARAMSRYASLIDDQFLNNRISEEREMDNKSMMLQCLNGLNRLGAALKVAPPADQLQAKGWINNGRWDELGKLINEDWRAILIANQFGLKAADLEVDMAATADPAE
ncbi:MAG: hypothetical protein KTR15_03225 [Phycisphaeraceae bacterium]|nr:hypothetical protein [Phycisphaeraceae bacterium]